MKTSANSIVRLGLPKGRMQAGLFTLLADAGVTIRLDARGYRPTLNLPEVETKILKPQNIVEMLHAGSRDFGFAGKDWVEELGVELVDLLDTSLDPVTLVAAAPRVSLVGGTLPKKHLVVASEYPRITERWIREAGLDATFVRSYGATEAFPPEDADCIVDNTASGSTLEANGLEIVADLMHSSTHFYANPRALDDPKKRAFADNLVMLLRSVLEARHRVMLEVNVSTADLERLVGVLPCMREPTISTLHGGAGYAVKVAVPRSELPSLIPEIKSRGGTDLVITALSQIVP
jgi:ATP phosphoribosyltransferase